MSNEHPTEIRWGFIELQALRTGNVTQYRVRFQGGTGPGPMAARAAIDLYKGEEQLGTVHFLHPGYPFPDDTEGEMNLPVAMFENVIDILRGEKPVTFHFMDGYALLATLREPVGEAE